MIPLSQLQYARKYPFSSVAKGIVKQLAPDVSKLESNVRDAALRVVEASAFTSSQERRAFVEQHVSKKDLSYAEFLQEDILAYPLSKVVLSCVRNPLLYERFAAMMADLTFEYLVREKDPFSALLELAQDLKLKIDLDTRGESVRVLVPFQVYLAVPLKDGQLHLVNQRVHKGNVLLELNLACRWVAEYVHALVLSSLPVNTQGLPKEIEELARSARTRIQARQVEESKLLAQNGVVLTAFPCMDKLYGEITNGANLPHMARFDLATFLVNIDMPFEDIVGVFSKASNYDERITRYHLDNLAGKTSGKKYSAPACAKVREHGLCISRTCNVTHPLQFYRRELTNTSKEKEGVEEQPHA